MAFTFEEAKQKATEGYKAFGSAGRFGEGGIAAYTETLRALKKGVQDGLLKITEYQDLVEPLTSGALQSINSLVAQGQPGLASTFSEQLRGEGFFKATPDNRNEFSLPFTRQETVKLPTNVLPTKDDIASGAISRDALPLLRLQDPTGGGTDANGNPIPADIKPGDIPADINLGSDRGAIELEAQRQAEQLGGAVEKQKEIRTGALDQIKQSLSGIPQQYRDEGDFQEQKLRGLATEQKDLRSTQLTSLAELLSQQQSQRFQDLIPEVAEQANVKGIYRSTGFGDSLSKEASKLERDRQTQLGIQGVNDYTQYVDAVGAAGQRGLDFRSQGLGADVEIQNQLAQQQYGIADQYAGGIGDVANTRAGLQTGGLQREFSLDDAARSTELAKMLTQMSQPSTSSAKTTEDKWNTGIQSGVALANGAMKAYAPK